MNIRNYWKAKQEVESARRNLEEARLELEKAEAWLAYVDAKIEQKSNIGREVFFEGA